MYLLRNQKIAQFTHSIDRKEGYNSRHSHDDATSKSLLFSYCRIYFFKKSLFPAFFFSFDHVTEKYHDKISNIYPGWEEYKIVPI